MLFCTGVSEKLLKNCGPLGAAVVSDELRSFTSSASCCATVEIPNINVSGEVLSCHRKKKQLNERCHFAFRQTPSEPLLVVLQGKSENDTKFSPYYCFFSQLFLITVSPSCYLCNLLHRTHYFCIAYKQ